MNVVIIDYGAGNAANVKNALDKLGASSAISSDATTWKNADGLIFPGVGSFGAAIKNIGPRMAVLKDTIERGVPFLGICLGMQLMLDESEESQGVSGLGLVSGKVRRFSFKPPVPSLPIPQIGWNKVEIVNSTASKAKCTLFAGLDAGFYAYFVHSYYCDPIDKSCVAATTDYGNKFVSSICRKNLFMTQFHPEKSGKDGLQLLQNFIAEVKK